MAVKKQKLRKIGRPVAQNSESPITQLRDKLQISQEQLGQLLGKSHPTIGRYERGTIKPTGLVLLALNEMLRKHGLPEITKKDSQS